MTGAPTLRVLDSSVWIEHLTAGPRSERCAGLFDDPAAIVVPAVVIYEVGRYVGRTSGDEILEEVLAHLTECSVEPLDAEIATLAIEVAAEHKIPMADALIAATAQHTGATLFSFDADLLGLPGTVEPIDLDA